jgi:hypothetical protein
MLMLLTKPMPPSTVALPTHEYMLPPSAVMETELMIGGVAAWAGEIRNARLRMSMIVFISSPEFEKELEP